MNQLRSPSNLRHKELYKAASPSWKESYRRRCSERLTSSRAKLLQRYRDVPNSVNPKADLDSSIVDDIMKEEWDSIQNQDNRPIASDLSAAIDVMEQIKLELMIQEREILLQYDRLKDFENTELDAAIEEHENSDSIGKIICPICHAHHLEQHFNVISCQCGLKIDADQGCFTLDHVGLQLKVGTTAHAEKCDARPVFGMLNNFGPQNLVMSCDSCDFMFIVI